MANESVNDQLVKNNILLQKKTAELLISVNNLTKKMDQMVGIFSKAAEHIEKEGVSEPLAARLSEVLEQNKQLANGLRAIERYVRERSAFSPELRK